MPKPDGAAPPEVADVLRAAEFPLMKEDLLDIARGQGAEAPVMSALEALPDREFGSPDEVVSALH